MRIIHLPNSYLPWSLGGKEVYSHELSKNLIQLGCDTSVIIHKNEKKVSEGEHEYEGVKVHVLPPVKTSKPVESRFTREVDEAPGFEEFLLTFEPDLVHFHDQSDGASLTHLRIAKKLGIKTVLTFHTPGQLCPQRALLYKNEVVCDGKHDLIRCTFCQLKYLGTPNLLARTFSRVGYDTSTHNKNRFQKLLNFRGLTSKYFDAFNEFCSEVDAIHIYAEWAVKMFINNGVQKDKIHFFRTGGKPSMRFNKRKFIPPLKLVYIGRCTYIKGIHVLIDAIKALEPNCKVEVHFFTPSWEKTSYGMEMGKRIQNDSRFKTPRQLPNDELPEVLKEMDLCVIPSTWLETGPITVFDAFSVGLPIIGANLGGIAELVKNGIDGLLFEPGNIDALAKIIQKVIDQPDLYLKLKSNIRPNRTMKDVAEDTLGIYKKLVN